MSILNEEIWETEGAEETEKAAAAFAKKLQNHDFIAFFGDLGSGKTAFVRGLCETLCPGARVCSPTFAIVNEYRGKPLNVYHFDLYRINDDDSLYATGFYDYFDRDGVMAAEWCENIPFALPEKRYDVIFEKIGENRRRITVRSVG